MKTVEDIKRELQTIQSGFKERLELFIKDNPDISVNISFETSNHFVNDIAGNKLGFGKEIESMLSISID